MSGVIVDCALYRDGKRTDESRSLPRLAAQARADSDSFVWMGLFEPSPTDLTGVARLFGIHPLAVEDAVKAHQRPKLDVYDNLLFLVLRTVWFDPEAESVSTGELMVLLGEHFVLTVRHGEGGSLENVRHTLEHGDALRCHGPAAVLHAICDAVADRYLEVAEQVEDVVEQVELDVFGDDKADDSARIYRLKREVHEFRRAVAPLAEPSSRLAADESVPFIPAELRPFFNDVSDHVLRASEQVESYDHQLSDIVQAHLSQVAVRQNEDMRKISAWVAIAAVPTMLAGIWGMNFTHMPDTKWVYGYPFALSLMAVACVVLYRMFKRSGWL